MPPVAATRVVVADDDRFMRRILCDALEHAGMEVVATATDGDQALETCARHAPDAMTLDLAMPGMGGIDVLRELRRRGAATPVVVVSAFSASAGRRALDCLQEGAVELVSKPDDGDLAGFSRRLCDTVRGAVRARRAPPEPRGEPAVAAAARVVRSSRLLVIASSTGGPRALMALVPALPPRVGAGGLIVQHMPPRFTRTLAARLDRASALTVREAAARDRLRGDTLLMAPGGAHLRLAGRRTTALSDEPEIGALRPRADLTIADAARRHGEQVVLVVLTGMGDDGVAGARQVRAAGGRVLVEAASTCVVHGMPRAVARAGLADAELPLDELPAAIAEELAR